MDVEFVDRYSACGIPEPCRWTICRGQCEGMGYVPIHRDDPSPGFRALWREADEEDPSDDPDDGWHFVKCPSCGGTGKRLIGWRGRLLETIHSFYYPFRYAVFSVTHRFEDWSFRTALRKMPGQFWWMWRRQAAVRRQRRMARRRER